MCQVNKKAKLLFHIDDCYGRFATTILIYPIIRSLHKKLLLRFFELLRSNTDILQSFGSAIAERDSDNTSPGISE